MIAPAEPAKVSHNEILKETHPTLAGSIAATLANPELDRFSDDDKEFLKFHGIYQQDDRDKRKTGKFYMFMVRGRLPGGVVTPDQYIAFDELATKYGNQTLRITSRQGFQFHGVVKSGLGKLMKGINESLSTTIAACGDVNRNVMAPSTPSTSVLVERVLEDARLLSTSLLPQTKAYHQIWLEGVELNLGEEDKNFVDPLYGKTYLPRKFKVAFAIPPLNDIDILTNCCGFIAIHEGDNLLGYNLCAGGGMGMSHGNAETFPRLADVIGFLKPKDVEAVARGVLTIHRDYGSRTNRKHARVKYILEDHGPAWFKEELERRLGFKLEAPKPYLFTKQGDMFGWHKQFNGKNFLGLYVETGRIKDTPEVRLKAALRLIAETFKPEIRLTPSQNLILADVPDDQIEGINRILAEHGVATDNQGSPVRLASMVCPALPTCGLALAESERIFPDLLDLVDATMKQAGLEKDEIIVRMTGCPNGCARPYMAEIGFVGRAPNKYQLFLGGNEACTKMNRLYKENVKYEEIASILQPVLTRFAQERNRGERFGDWCERSLFHEQPTVPAEVVTAVGK
ncbi:MAG: NADPH-dependent assimilatory sulfite reductase hemoprotein subunit [Verrucomicrobiales bacterium]